MLEEKYESKRTRALRRHVDWTKAVRKRDLTEELFYWVGHPYYDNLHQYSKNKIHCSCGLCRDKTNNKSPRKRKIHGNYAPSYNPSINERRQNDSMDAKINEFEDID